MNNGNTPQPSRRTFRTVCEVARQHGYGLVVTSRRTWLIKGLKWRSVRTEEVAAYLLAQEPRKAPSVAENAPNEGEDTNTARQ